MYINIASHADVRRGSSLSPPQRPLCVVGRLGRKKKRAHGARWEGERQKRGSRLFLLPIVPRALSVFSTIANFMGIPSGSLCGGERGFVKRRLHGPFLLGQFTIIASSSAKRFKSLKFVAFSRKNDKPSHLFLSYMGRGIGRGRVCSKSTVTQ